MGKLVSVGDGEFNFYPETPAEKDRAMRAADRYNGNTFRLNRYAALEFYRCGDRAAKEELSALKIAYEQSRTTTPGPGWERIPRPPGQEYLPFQLAGIQYAAARRHCLIGDAPGLGKTIQGIGLANLIRAKRVLVICPGNVRINWDRQVRAWSTDDDVETYPILKSADGVSPYANYLITSFELARSDSIKAALLALKFDLLIIDEGHYLKSPEARRTRAVFGGRELAYETAEDGGLATVQRELLGIASRAARVLALTGTPLPNRPRECYTLARNLCWDSIDWSSEEGFAFRYNPSNQWGEEAGRLMELQVRLRTHFMIRRLKEDVLKDLPAKRYELAYVEENGDIRRALRHERLLDIKLSDLENPDFQLLGQVSTVRREMGEAMVPRMVEHVKMLLDGGVEKLVLFAHHRSVMDKLAGRLHEHGVATVRGGMSPRAKQAEIDRFIAEPEVAVFLAQLNVGGTGIDGLQHVASHVVFGEASWVPGENEQAIDRLHRHGQRDSVLAQFLVAPESISEKILGKIVEKQGIIHSSLDEVR